ncbi:MAG: hypothetical protein LIV26_10670, partial [Atopobium sp.]|nr:hypothetical protein [Atopobium sp.]
PNTKTDGPAGDFVFGDAIIPSGVPGGQAIRAASIRTLVDYSKAIQTVEHLAAAEDSDGKALALIGAQEGRLEMLFVGSSCRNGA